MSGLHQRAISVIIIRCAEGFLSFRLTEQASQHRLQTANALQVPFLELIGLTIDTCQKKKKTKIIRTQSPRQNTNLRCPNVIQHGAMAMGATQGFSRFHVEVRGNRL